MGSHLVLLSLWGAALAAMAGCTMPAAGRTSMRDADKYSPTSASIIPPGSFLDREYGQEGVAMAALSAELGKAEDDIRRSLKQLKAADQQLKGIFETLFGSKGSYDVNPEQPPQVVEDCRGEADNVKCGDMARCCNEICTPVSQWEMAKRRRPRGMEFPPCPVKGVTRELREVPLW
ncbi:unnamed protein product [Vitrella brassicaformis CCMP3155]|uniref:WAP domain-containing protein n=1 Tax=Vitrella brassicaformis (strain CCMP3155) TaxID=1169540 RepID=A0A0G4G135_VITBC|nr:unnamed protein product [Vitrella brassicaformis CCMP3155]|eukprot:CEM21779.1 unnamed protein product [Vitrella brassicaformis CCMP3155]